jgi:hypothetical protein
LAVPPRQSTTEKRFCTRATILLQEIILIFPEEGCGYSGHPEGALGLEYATDAIVQCLIARAHSLAAL